MYARPSILLHHKKQSKSTLMERKWVQPVILAVLLLVEEH